MNVDEFQQWFAQHVPPGSDVRLAADLRLDLGLDDASFLQLVAAFDELARDHDAPAQVGIYTEVLSVHDLYFHYLQVISMPPNASS